MKPVTKQFADFICGVEYENLPPEVIRETKNRVIDIIAAAFIGCSESSMKNGLYRAAKTVNGTYQARIWGSQQQKSSIAMAALCNAAMAHSMELDDGHRYAGVHAGCVAVPTAFSVAEWLGSTGKEVIEAIVASYEITYRLARNITPEHIQLGFHPTGCTAVYGAAAAAAKLMKLTPEQTQNALGLAGMKSAGFMEIVTSGQASKGLLPGHAAHEGVWCAILAKEGLVGSETVIDGDNGLVKAMSRNVDVEQIVADLGKRFEIMDTYTKLYPTCRHMHQPAENVMALKEEHNLDYHQVENIVCRVSKVAKKLSGLIIQPKTPDEARFSMACATALAFKYGNLSLPLMEKAMVDSEIIELENKVTVVVDDYVESLLPKTRCAITEVTMCDGSVYTKEGTVLRGSPDLPADYAQLSTKFRDCAQKVLSEQQIDNTIDKVSKLETLDSVIEIIDELMV